jgi:Cdc6-like AAA superfamily ATPase
VKDPKVQSFLNTETPAHSILCINGKKGAGKTILASRIIDHCVEHREDFKTSYFYCREDDPSQNNCLAIYKSLVIQMLSHYPDLLPSCHERKLRGNEMLNEEPTARALIGLFCNADMNQFIIIDGVDEIDSAQRRSLVQYLAGLVAKCDAYKPGKVRVLFLSHDLADYSQLKCMEPTATLQLDADIIQKDIKIYLTKKAEELKRAVGLTDEELSKAQELTLKRSDG